MFYTFRTFREEPVLLRGVFLKSEEAHKIVGDYIKEYGKTKEIKTELIKAMFEEAYNSYRNGACYCMFLKQLRLVLFKNYYASAYIKECKQLQEENEHKE